MRGYGAGMEQVVGPACGGAVLTFGLRDQDRRLAGVRLVQEVGISDDQLHFRYDGEAGGWRLDVPRPAVWRLEYRLELHHPDGDTEVVCDPANPRRAPGAFGDRSVLQCPDYTEPGWLTLPAADGCWRDLTIRAPAIRSQLPTRIFSPAEPTDRVLLAHDGPEYDRLASLGRYSAAMIGAGTVPAHHLVLLPPGDRDEWYSASAAYAWSLVADVLPRLQAELGTNRPVVGMGASLGGLAMLHAQRRYPKAFEGLFLQSGSFFLPRHDHQESGFRRYLRIIRFAGLVDRQVWPAAPHAQVPTVLTCGRVEENVHNNREMARSLRRQGYPVELFEVPDAHNHVGWRDAFHPYLTDLLRRVWGG
jgi:enterochelin esterase family protein